MKTYTAAELAGSWWWDEKYCISADGGKTLWESACHTSRGGSIRLMRLDNATCKAFMRYVPLKTKMRLFPK